MVEEKSMTDSFHLLYLNGLFNGLYLILLFTQSRAHLCRVFFFPLSLKFFLTFPQTHSHYKGCIGRVQSLAQGYLDIQTG